MTDQIVNEFAQGVIDGIRENIATKRVNGRDPMNSSGKAIDSLFYRWDGKTLIVGSTWEFITVLEDGRAPGRKPPREAIADYVDKKPIEGGINKDSLAYLIQRSIGEKGTLLYRDGGHSGIISDYINEDYIQENLIDKLRDNIVVTLSHSLIGETV